MKRNIGIDLLKTFCAFLVVCIHTTIPGTLGIICTPLTKIAVPLFFTITGYYYSNTKAAGKEKSQIIKILKLFASSIILFFLWGLLRTLLDGNSVAEFIKGIFSLRSILKLIILNDPPFGGHLWYLVALLYVLVIVFVVDKKWGRQKLYPLIPLFLLTDLVFGKYSLILFKTELPQILVRNFFSVGLPFFLIGDMLNTRPIKVRPKTAIPLVLLFALTTIAERLLLGYFDVNAARDHYISTNLCVVYLFLLAVQFKGNGSKLCNLLAYVGANLSSAIYILHPIFITVFASVVARTSKYIPMQSVYPYVAPFVVMVATAFASWVYHLAVKKVKAKRT